MDSTALAQFVQGRSRTLRTPHSAHRYFFHPMIHERNHVPLLRTFTQEYLFAPPRPPPPTPRRCRERWIFGQWLRRIARRGCPLSVKPCARSWRGLLACSNFCSNSAVESGRRQSKPVNSTPRSIRKQATQYRVLPALAEQGLLES